MRIHMEHVESTDAPDDRTVVFNQKQAFGPSLGIVEPGTAPKILKHKHEGALAEAE